MSLETDMLRLSLGTDKKFHCVSLDVTLEDTVNKLLDGAKTSVAIKDHYRNTLSATGTADKVESFSQYGFNNDTLNWPLWLALYNDSWVFRRAIDKPAQDEVNCGFTLFGDVDFSKAYKSFGRYKSDMIRLLMWGALFGGSVAVMMFDTVPDEEMQNPIKLAKIKGARMRLYVTDRWYGVSTEGSETVSDMRDIDFGKPTMYNITFADGKSFRVHHSYVLRYEHRTAPQLVKTGQLQGWGYAEGAHILNELSRDDQLKSSITSLVNKSLIEVIKMSGMRGVFMGTDKGNEEQLRKRLEMVNWGRTYNSLTFLDKDDEYEQREFSGLTGLAQLIESNMWLVAAALEMPGVLFGELRGGLSQETESMEKYATTIESRCNTYYRPVLQKLLMVIFAIHGIDAPVDFEFNSLVANERNKIKMEALENYDRVLGSMLDRGIISKYQVASSLKGFLENGAVSVNFSEENLNRLRIEEEFQILEALKNFGKGSKTAKSILQSQFGSPGGNEKESVLPENLSYLDPNASPEEVETSEMREQYTQGHEAPEMNREANTAEAPTTSEGE